LPKKNAKSKRPEAERAAEWLAYVVYHCVITVRAVRTKWQRQDLFAADVMGKQSDGSYVFIQATAGSYSAVSVRRKKLERVPWLVSDIVLVAQLVQTEDPANSRRKLWFFRIHEFVDNQWITLDDAIPVPKHWFTAYKNRDEYTS
jgi:hypothetical protein